MCFGFSFFVLCFLKICIVVSGQNISQPEITNLHVKSHIISRFATTLVNSRLKNPNNFSTEAVFVAQLPDSAFISNFSMKIDDRLLYGLVKEKEKAKKEYEQAKSRGQSAGLVSQTPRETNTFQIAVNVEAFGKVAFNLTYQQMLQRVQGAYKHVINIQPGQLVPDLSVDVYITESTGLKQVWVPQIGAKMGQKNNKELLKLPESKDVQVKTAVTPEISFAHISYKPDVKKQKELKIDKKGGMVGQMVVLYDVERDSDGGELKVVNGYFVHFFAPSDLPVMSKEIVFVIDSSGSMSGRKMEQTKQAMKTILNQLKSGDKFAVLDFDSTVKPWKSYSVAVDGDNIHEAQEFVDGLETQGGTNIYEALSEALNVFNNERDARLVPMVIFLTDGEATEGPVNDWPILDNVKKLNKDLHATIQCISFGVGADYDLLKKLSLQNNGLARKIYEDSDATLQLEGFYDEVSNLLLRDVKIDYLNEAVEPESIVQDNEYNYFEGSEFLIVGKTNEGKGSFSAMIEGEGEGGIDQFTVSSIAICTLPGEESTCMAIPEPPPDHNLEWSPLPSDTVGGFIERMWAYMSIKKMIEQSKYGSDDKKAASKAKALQLSLKYHFVTELTSLVITEPDAKNDSLLSLGGRKSDTESKKSPVSPKNLVSYSGILPDWSQGCSRPDLAAFASFFAAIIIQLFA